MRRSIGLHKVVDGRSALSQAGGCRHAPERKKMMVGSPVQGGDLGRNPLAGRVQESHQNSGGEEANSLENSEEDVLR